MPQPDSNTPWLRFMLNAILASLTIDPDRRVEDLQIEREAAADMLAAFQVQNAIEAAFAAQAVAAWHAARECYRRAALMSASFPATGRVFATAMSLSRMSLQRVRAIAACRPAVRPAPRAGMAKPLAAVMGRMNPYAKRRTSRCRQPARNGTRGDELEQPHARGNTNDTPSPAGIAGLDLTAEEREAPQP